MGRPENIVGIPYGLGITNCIDVGVTDPAVHTVDPYSSEEHRLVDPTFKE